MMFLIKRVSLILIICLVVACSTTTTGKPIPNELKRVYTAHEVLIRIQELQRTVIGLHDATPSLIDKKNADIIVLFTTSSAGIVQAAVNSTDNNRAWEAVIKSSWIDLKTEYTPTNPNLRIIWALVDAAIMSLDRMT